MGSDPDDDVLRGIEHDLADEAADFVRAFRPDGSFLRRHRRRLITITAVVLLVVCLLMIVAGRATEAWLLGILGCALLIWRYRGRIQR